MATPALSVTTSPRELREVRHARVFASTTPAVLPALPQPLSTPRSPRSPVPPPARKTVIRAKDLTPPAGPVAVARATRTAAPEPADIPQASLQPISSPPSPSPQPIATTGILVPSAPPPAVVATAGLIRTEEVVVRDLLEGTGARTSSSMQKRRGGFGLAWTSGASPGRSRLWYPRRWTSRSAASTSTAREAWRHVADGPRTWSASGNVPPRFRIVVGPFSYTRPTRDGLSIRSAPSNAHQDALAMGRSTPRRRARRVRILFL